MFNLSALIPKGPDQPYKFIPKSFSDSEISSLLNGYELVPENERNTLKTNIHIRYMKENGEFKKGGYVVNTYISNKPETKGNIMIRLKSSLAPNAKEWTINLSKVSDVWRTTKFKPKKTIENISEDLKIAKDDTKSQIEQINIELFRLANENRRIIALIKKLHNINI